MSVRQVKKRIFDIIQIGTRVDIPSTLFDIFISCMILMSIVVTFLQTFEQMAPHRELLNRLELFTIIIFIIEYILRVCTSDLLYPRKHFWASILLFVFSFYGLIDLFTIVSYFSALFTNGIVALRIIRVVRIMRLFKVNQSFDAFNVVAEIIMEKKSQLIFSMFMIATMMLAASLMMYSLEHEAQPEVFNNAFSGIWWAMSTVLTVGYGDIYPITLGGRIAAIFIALLGVCAVAIPSGVISAGFVEHYTRLNRNGSFVELPEDLRLLAEKRAGSLGVDVQTYVEHLILMQETTGASLQLIQYPEEGEEQGDQRKGSSKKFDQKKDGSKKGIPKKDSPKKI